MLLSIRRRILERVLLSALLATIFASLSLTAGPATGSEQNATAPPASKETTHAASSPSQKRPIDPLHGLPFVTAKAWAIADGRTGKVLWGHQEAKPVDIASTTKIMTALVIGRLAAKDPKILDEIVVFSKRADQTIGSTAGVNAGERVPVRELLYGLLLPSGNDAAVAFAEHFGDRCERTKHEATETDPLPKFIAEMNRVAAELGLHETHYINPNGLTATNHRSSARDLARLTRIALDDPHFAAIVATPRHESTLVDDKGQKRHVVWTNTNELLKIEGYDGVKTGTTQAAGACLVASGRRGQDHLIVVILGAGSSDGRYADARNLFRWAWIERGHKDPGVPHNKPAATAE